MLEKFERYPLTFGPTHIEFLPRLTEALGRVDAVFLGHEGELRYDFHVAPGADPDQIKLAFDGVSELSLADNGDLVLATGAGDVIHRAPIVYQDVDGVRVRIDAGFEFGEDREVHFALADFDRTRPLVIDPVISYSTFLGGAGADSGRSVRVDPADQTIVVTGRTRSLDFPLAGALQTTHGNDGDDIPNGWFPNPNGTQLAWKVEMLTRSPNAAQTAQVDAINIANNRRPNFTDQGDLAGVEGQNFLSTLELYFSDPDGDSLTYQISGLPAGTGLSLDANTGQLSGVPTNDDAIS